MHEIEICRGTSEGPRSGLGPLQISDAMCTARCCARIWKCLNASHVINYFLSIFGTFGSAANSQPRLPYKAEQGAIGGHAFRQNAALDIPCPLLFFVSC